MTRTCDNCGRSFATELALDLHRDSCVDDQLACRRCGERFEESTATTDGWHFACPNDDCEGSGLEEDLVRLDELRVGTP